MISRNFRTHCGLTVAVLFVSFSSAASQDNGLQKFRTFFNDQVSEYQNWLDNTSLSPVLSVDSTRPGNLPDKLKIESVKVTLFLKSKGIGYWNALQQAFPRINFGDSLNNELMRQFAGLMDLEKKEAFIVITGEDMLVRLSYDNNKVVTQSTVSKGTVEGSLTVQLDKSKFTKGGTVKGNGREAAIKAMIIKMLKDDLGRREFRPLIDDANVSIKEAETADNLIALRAMNFTKRVIPGNVLGVGYYEYLDFTIELVRDPKQKESIEVKFKVYGKYGSGLFSPKETRYKPMAPKYINYLNDYVKELEGSIVKLLK